MTDGSTDAATGADGDVYGLALDGDGIVVGATRSNVAQPGLTAVSADVYAAVCAFGVGRCRFDGAAVAAYAPPAPQATLTVTGNQWAFALADMNLSAAWQVGVAKSKAKDQVRIGLIARDTPLVASDPLLIRVTANAGTVDGTASGPAMIDVPTVFARAQGMPT